jgi:hypothetical protein
MVIELLRPAAMALALLAIPILVLARRLQPRRELRPSVRFFEVDAPAGKSRARRPPLSAWLAALACVLGAVAAAGVHWNRGTPFVQILFDASARMSKTDTGGATRLDRARTAAARFLDSQPVATTVRWNVVPGSAGIGSVDEAKRALGSVVASPRFVDIAAAVSAFPDRNEWVIFTGSDADFGPGMNVYRFGAIPTAVSVTSVLANPSRVGVTNWGSEPADGVVQSGSLSVPWQLAPRESRIVAVPDATQATVRVENPRRALPSIHVVFPAAGLRVSYDPKTPEALRRAVDAAAASRGPLQESSPRLRVAPAGSDVADSPALVFNADGFLETEPHGTASATELRIPQGRRVRAAHVGPCDPWVVDGSHASRVLAGVRGRVALAGFDFNDSRWTQWSVAPVLVASLLDAVCPVAADSLDPRIAGESGALGDAVEWSFRPASSQRRAATDLSTSFALAAALSAAAACFFELKYLLSGKRPSVALHE